MSDTHPAAAAAQIELLRRATVARRFALLRSMTSTTMDLSKRAIRRSMPGADQRELDIRFVELHYGKELAARLRQFLEQRDS